MSNLDEGKLHEHGRGRLKHDIIGVSEGIIIASTPAKGAGKHHRSGEVYAVLPKKGKKWENTPFTAPKAGAKWGKKPAKLPQCRR